jgi:broad specificity phosphatase PhoE
MESREEQKWPDVLWIVRHGESAGNVARDAADAARLPRIDIATRDVDVPLSALGERQARALGRWFGALGDGERPTVVLSSPYVRARHTADIIRETAGLHLDDLTFVTDERLREKEFGSCTRSRPSSARCSASSTTGRRAARAGPT